MVVEFPNISQTEMHHIIEEAKRVGFTNFTQETPTTLASDDRLTLRYLREIAIDLQNDE